MIAHGYTAATSIPTAMQNRASVTVMRYDDAYCTHAALTAQITADRNTASGIARVIDGCRIKRMSTGPNARDAAMTKATRERRSPAPRAPRSLRPRNPMPRTR